MIRKILVANDGSDGARIAVEHAVELAAYCRAELHCLSVEEALPHYAATIDEVETIVNFCRGGEFDLLVIGFMGHSRIFERIWGSTSQTLTRLAPCSVLVAK